MKVAIVGSRNLYVDDLGKYLPPYRYGNARPVGTAFAAVRKSAKVGSDSEPSGGRLQPSRRAERDFCGKGGVA